MPASTIYTVRIGGVRNPRFLIDNALLSESAKQYFILKTYGTHSTKFIDSSDLIDYGKGSPVDITTASKLGTFSIENYNSTNGVNSIYLITWFTEIAIKDGDELEIVFPVETILITKDWPSTANREINCEGVNGITKIRCERDKKNERLMHIQLKKVS
jgi:hypothetical protein